MEICREDSTQAVTGEWGDGDRTCYPSLQHLARSQGQLLSHSDRPQDEGGFSGDVKQLWQVREEQSYDFLPAVTTAQ
ncbi:MAG: hypothetical protein ACM37W_11760 [Actinomycetota bacterium]